VSTPSRSSLNRRPAIPRVLKPEGRLLVSLLAAGLAALLAAPLPRYEMRVIAAFDTGAMVYLGLFVTLMNRATPEDAADMSKSNRSLVGKVIALLGIVVMSLISADAVFALALSGIGKTSHFNRILAITVSLVAICMAWLLSHVAFGLYYMGLYYSDTVVDENPYDEGMAYPNRKLPDYWDFMYYSFTIAMCYQTSDVTITNHLIRRVTLLHAIFSFFFVAAIVGLVVNIVSNAF
jgi:uncharacterized membrane protein